MGGRPRLLTRAPRLGSALPRPRLHDAAAGAPLVVVTAAPGSGCTTLAAQLAEADGPTTAWCRLAHGFNRAADVTEMIADALAVSLAPGRRVVDLADQWLDLFDQGRLTVVIDDYDAVADGDLDRVVAECVALVPPGCRIVLTSASRPAGLIGLVPPAALRLLDAADLAFSPEEARDLFTRAGATPDDAARWHERLGGWAQGLAAGALAPAGDPDLHLDGLLDSLGRVDPTGGAVVDTLAAVPYLTPPLLADLHPGLDDGALAALAAASPLVADHDGFVRMSPVAADLHLARCDPDRVREARASAGALLAEHDPTSAIDLLIAAGLPDAAADVLAENLSEIGVERALDWLYRLPAELRRRFPPVLAAGQATVTVDLALADATARVEAATTPRARREALFALGSVEAHRGELAAAAGAFEAARRAARDDPAAVDRIAAELATTRWLLGDRVGARAALDGVASTPQTRWLLTQLDVVDGRSSGHRVTGEPADAHDLAAMSLSSLAAGDTDTAAELATASFGAASETGGEPFVAASAVRGWTLLRAGRHDEALAVAEELERRMGAAHRLARVHAAILRERSGRTSDDTARRERDRRRLRDLRRGGYGSIEELAARVIDGESHGEPAGLEVRVLREHVVACDGRIIRRGEWKSKKALEVLTVLASHGPTGARREQVVEAVWPGRPPEKGRTLLRTALSEIRRVLEPDRPAGEGSRHLTTSEDLITVAGHLDLDRVEAQVTTDPGAAFSATAEGLAPEVVEAEWAQDWLPRVERLALRAATAVAERGERPQRIEALEALISAEPWQRSHYDTLATLHREGGDEAAAVDVERRWFADD